MNIITKGAKVCQFQHNQSFPNEIILELSCACKLIIYIKKIYSDIYLATTAFTDFKTRESLIRSSTVEYLSFSSQDFRIIYYSFIPTKVSQEHSAFGVITYILFQLIIVAPSLHRDSNSLEVMTLRTKTIFFPPNILRVPSELSFFLQATNSFFEARLYCHSNSVVQSFRIGNCEDLFGIASWSFPFGTKFIFLMFLMFRHTSQKWLFGIFTWRLVCFVWLPLSSSFHRARSQ